MAISDSVADFLTCLRNAVRASHSEVKVSGSKMNKAILQVLQKEKFIHSFSVVNEEKNRYKFLVKLCYYKDTGEPAFYYIDRISKPGCRHYVPKSQLRTIKGGTGIEIVSTSKGVMTSSKARSFGIGGEVICTVY